MRGPRIGQIEHRIHLGCRERDRWRVEPDLLVAMALHDRPRVAGIGLQVEHPRGMGIQHRIPLHLFEGGDADHRLVARRAPRDLSLKAHDLRTRVALYRQAVLPFGIGTGRRRDHRVGVGVGVHRPRGIDLAGVQFDKAGGDRIPQEGRATKIRDLARVLARGHAMRQLHQGPFGITEQQDVRARIQQHGAPDLVLPVVVVGNAAQAGLDPAGDDRHILVRLAGTLGVNDDRAVGTPAVHIPRRIGVVGTDLPLGRVVVDHRIHVPGGHAEKQVGPAQCAEWLGRRPVRLGENTHPEPLRLQQPPDDRHAEARVIDIGIAGDQNDVTAVPAERVHLLARGRQERCRAKALGPVGLAGKQGLGGCGHHQASSGGRRQREIRALHARDAPRSTGHGRGRGFTMAGPAELADQPARGLISSAR